MGAAIKYALKLLIGVVAVRFVLRSVWRDGYQVGVGDGIRKAFSYAAQEDVDSPIMDHGVTNHNNDIGLN